MQKAPPMTKLFIFYFLCANLQKRILTSKNIFKKFAFTRKKITIDKKIILCTCQIFIVTFFFVKKLHNQKILFTFAGIIYKTIFLALYNGEKC